MSTTMYSLSLSHGLWSLSWILEPFRSHQHPSESLSSLRTCQHAPADSLLRVSGVCTEEALLWNTISEVGGCPQYFRALSKGWCVRSHTSGLSQSERVPQQAHLRLKVSAEQRLCLGTWGKRPSLTSLVRRSCLKARDCHYLKYLLKTSGI